MFNLVNSFFRIYLERFTLKKCIADELPANLMSITYFMDALINRLTE